MAAAAVAVATSVLKIPTPATSGYLNFGDVVVIYFAFVLGPRRGALAGGMGSAAADFIGGYPYFVPVTFVAKGLEGYVAGLLGGPDRSPYLRLLGASAGALCMVACYFLWHIPNVGWHAALAGIPGNLLQGGLGVLGALMLNRALDRRGIGRANASGA
jgi:uncharacterized membrane protein